MAKEKGVGKRAAGKGKEAGAGEGAGGGGPAPRALLYSLKPTKGGRQLAVTIQIPRSTPSSVLNVEADEQGLRVDTGKWGGGYALTVEWPAPFAGKVRAGKDIEVGRHARPLLCLRDVRPGDASTSG
jgi:hypothetical protein